jgi:hypothetical protein
VEREIRDDCKLALQAGGKLAFVVGSGAVAVSGEDLLARESRKSAGWLKAAALLLLAATTACTNADRFTGQAEQAPASAPPASTPPPPSAPPPIDLAGRWKLSVATGGCLMTFTANPGATEGSIAPAGGCPGNFFTSRKWSFERDRLMIRDHKGEPLAELGFEDQHFEGKAANGTAVSLARP